MRLLSERMFDLVVIHTPIADEDGVGLAESIALQSDTQVILLLEEAQADPLAERLEAGGIITLRQPVAPQLFHSALKGAIAAHARMERLRGENQRLKDQIEENRIIDRAKCLLISHLRMTETQAHKTIEKRAMDMRITRREVAEGILRAYQN